MADYPTTTMPRLAQSPADADERIAKCLALLGDDPSVRLGVREVARQVGCSPSSVVRWREAAAEARRKASGLVSAEEKPPRRWDRWDSAGGKWAGRERERAQSAAARASRREAARVQALPTGAAERADWERQESSALIDSLRAHAERSAPWDNEVAVKRALVRVSMSASAVTGGAFSAWTTKALVHAFDANLATALPSELFASVDEWRDATWQLLVRSARRAGLQQDEKGVWQVPSSADSG